jgi:methylenetetrahydrofolate dehydrogenase (NADP+) / methenyltetrahydrofolate cyclohydrolase
VSSPRGRTAELIDGRAIARDLRDVVAREVDDLREDGLSCALAVVMVGETYSSSAYERRLARLAESLNVPYRRYVLPATCSQTDVVDLLHRLNLDRSVSGILVLRPLAQHIHEPTVFEALSVLKDVEAVHPENAGLLALGTPRYVPSTAASVFHILDAWLVSAGHDLEEFYRRSCIAVVGRSSNVGKPAVSLAYARQAVVISVDEWASRLGRLSEMTRQADVLVVAAGVAGLIGAEHVKEGAIVLDVGINRREDPVSHEVHMVGDVDTAAAATRARAITPVPGGIGPVTDIWLLRNTVAAARNIAAADRGPDHPPAVTIACVAGQMALDRNSSDDGSLRVTT